MHILNTFIAQSSFSLFREPILSTFRNQQRTIALIVTLSLGFFAVRYFIKHYCFKAKSIDHKQENLLVKNSPNLSSNPIKTSPLDKKEQKKALKPLLLINIDVNGTIISKDSTKQYSKDLSNKNFSNQQKYDEFMILCTLAKNTFAKWEEESEEMSFKQYVDTVLFPGERSNSQLIAKRHEAIVSFLEWLNEKSHPAQNAVLENYQKMRNTFTDPMSGEVHFTVFPSFYVMLEKLRKMDIPFKIIFRSFGSDLPGVVDEIEKNVEGIVISHWAKFKDTKLIVQGNKTVEKIEDIFDHFITSEGHFAVQDDWSTWNKDEERGRSGKPFIYDASGIRTSKNLSLIFDDNITGEEQDIVHPCEITGKKTSVKELFEKYIFPVNTMEAILDEDYFIKRILKAIDEKEVY